MDIMHFSTRFEYRFGEERSVNLIGGIYFPDEFEIRRDSRRGFNRVSGPRPCALSILRIIDTS